MKEIIERWCKTNQLSLEEANTLITEYLSIDNRTITGEQLSAILQIGQSFLPINWDDIIGKICIKNNWTLITVQSKPDQFGNRQILYRYIY